jgi:hypothetical protein
MKDGKCETLTLDNVSVKPLWFQKNEFIESEFTTKVIFFATTVAC